MSRTLHLEISQDERKILKEEFDKLESLQQKCDFWQVKLERNFLFWAYYPSNEIRDFMIWPKNKTEIKALNKFIMEHYVTMPDWMQYPNSEKLESQFEERLQQVADKEYLVESELIKINNYVNSRRQLFLNDIYEIDSNNSFIKGFERYLLMNEEIDLTEKLYPAHQLIALNCGVKYAKYKKMVEGCLRIERKPDELKLNGEQKFLALYQLGFGYEIEKASDKAKLYNCFIPELSETTIRIMFSKVEDHFTEKNIEALSDFFRLLKLGLIARDIEDKSVKQNKKK